MTRVANEIIKVSDLALESELGNDPFLKQQSWSDDGVANVQLNRSTDWKVHVIDDPRIQNAFVLEANL